MGKVVCIQTRQEINGLPYTREDGEAILKALLGGNMGRTYKHGDKIVQLIQDVIWMIENNTGASHLDVMAQLDTEEKVG